MWFLFKRKKCSR